MRGSGGFSSIPGCTRELEEVTGGTPGQVSADWGPLWGTRLISGQGGGLGVESWMVRAGEAS